MKRFWIAGVLTSIVLGAASVPPGFASALDLRVSGAVLEVDGVTPGAEIFWFGVARERSGERTRVLRRHGLEPDTNGDGAVTAALEAPPAPHSVWMAVDMASGASATWQPGDLPAGRLELPEGALTLDAPGTGESLTLTHRMVDLVLVRPGAGAWWLAVGDGGTTDTDRAVNGVLEISIDQMVALDGSPAAPSALAEGDVVGVIDPRSLASTLTQVARGDG